MTDQIQIADAPKIHTAVICGQVRPRELSRFVPAACGEVWTFAKAAGLSRPGRHVALYLDNQGTVEVGVEVAEPFTGNERVHCSQLPVGRVASAVHFGSYAQLGETHIELKQWCDAHGHERTGICWEVYGHWEERWNADPSLIRTDVFYLLATH